jgi:class 3 adenylate cyclase/tetratricopeptide (TPR) repeat protein
VPEVQPGLRVAFLPDDVTAAFGGSGRLEPGRVFGTSGSVLFADISGFTALSEALGRRGSAGTEELTAILNERFAAMIEQAHALGGVVWKFGGDALTVLFPYDARSRRASTRRSLRCALEIARASRDGVVETAGGRFALPARIGLAAGRLGWTVVGDEEIRLEHVVAGDPIQLAARAQRSAAPGEVVLHESASEWCGTIDRRWRRGSWSCVTGLRPAPATRRRPRPSRALPGERLRRFLHPSIAARLELGPAGFVNEHRTVTVLFVGFGLGARGPLESAAGERLQSYLASVVDVLARYDAFLRQVEIGEKGSLFIACVGAPVKHDDDERRALACALDLLALAPRRSRIGVTTGRVYCGQVGSEARWEYAVIGDTVNLASRLQQAAAGGEILVDGATRRAARGFRWSGVERLDVKGKSRPVPVRRLRGRAERSGVPARARLPRLAGRRRELARGGELLDRSRGGRGRLVCLTGEPGVGKSRLATELLRLAAEAGFLCLDGAARPYEASSYLAWRRPVYGLLGLEPSRPPRTLPRAVVPGLESLAPRLTGLAPVLGPILNVSLADTETTATLDPELRSEAARSLVLELLRARASAAPVCLLLDDCQWLDAPSAALLEHVARSIARLPVLVVVVARPGTELLASLARLPHAEAIELGELDPQAAAEVAQAERQRLVGGVDLPEEALERIVARAGGNPLLLQELIAFLARGGGLGAKEEAMPDSVQSLVLARIDRLGEAEKLTLKVASVVGPDFSADWVAGGAPELGGSAAVGERLATLAADDFVVAGATPPGVARSLDYRFRHVLVQQAAYETLTLATRGEVHGRIAEHVEAAAGDDADRFLDAIAFHYGRSRNEDKQRLYFRRAGEAAQTAYDNDSAVGYFRRLLPLVEGTDRCETLLALGDVWQLTGRWNDAESVYREAFRRARRVRSEQHVADARAAIGELLSFTTTTGEALGWLGSAKESYERIGDERGLGRVLEHLAITLLRRGEWSDAYTHAREHLRLARRTRDPVAASVASEHLGASAWQLGRLAEAARRFQTAIETAASCGYRRGLVHAHNDLAGLRWQQGDLAGALQSLGEALSAATEIGYKRAVGHILANAGELYRTHGQAALALRHYDAALETAGELGDRTLALMALGNGGLAALDLGRFEAAERLLGEAVALAELVGDADSAAEFGLGQARALLELEREEAAADRARSACEAAEQVGRTDIVVESRLLSVRLDVFAGRTSPVAAARELQALAATLDDPEPRASVLYEAWRLGGRKTARDRAASLYRRLHRRSPAAEYRRRHRELTGQALPEPEPLAPLATVDTKEQLDDLEARALEHARALAG